MGNFGPPSLQSMELERKIRRLKNTIALLEAKVNELTRELNALKVTISNHELDSYQWQEKLNREVTRLDEEMHIG